MPQLFPSFLIQWRPVNPPPLPFSFISLPQAAPPCFSTLSTLCTQLNTKSTQQWHIVVCCVCMCQTLCVHIVGSITGVSLDTTPPFIIYTFQLIQQANQTQRAYGAGLYFRPGLWHGSSDLPWSCLQFHLYLSWQGVFHFPSSANGITALCYSFWMIPISCHHYSGCSSLSP